MSAKCRQNAPTSISPGVVYGSNIRGIEPNLAMAGVGGSRTLPLPVVTVYSGFEVETARNRSLVEEFLLDRKHRGLSPRTCQFYQGYLGIFIRGLTRPVLSLKKADVTRFLGSLTCNQGGKHAYFRAIRAFYRWAQEEELISKTPVDRMKAPKVPQPIRHTVNLDSLPLLLESCTSVRDKLIVTMLADTGVRLSELVGIKTADIDLNLFSWSHLLPNGLFKICQTKQRSDGIRTRHRT